MKLIVNKTLSKNNTSGGGVGGYYRVLRKYSNNFTFLDVTYSTKKHGYIDSIKKYVYYLKLFVKYIKDSKAEVVVFNPSLSLATLLRDALYHMICSVYRTKQIIFFRGWNDDFAEKISSGGASRVLFNHIYKKRADAFIVLSERFKDTLIEWRVDQPVFVETTIVDESLLNGFSIKNKSSDNRKCELLFLSRIESAKGVLEAAKAVHLLTEHSNSINLNIAGDGSAIADLEEFISSNELSNIRLLGYVKEEQKVEAFKQSNIFIFPSNHGEGMPNSVLEAMAFGLPVITTRVGGIPDFFEEGKMGLFLDSRDPQHIAEKIQYLLDRPELMKQMSEYNYNYAKEHFYASKVAARLEKIIDDVAEERV